MLLIKVMVKNALLTLSLLLAAIVAQAVPVTLEKARENALAFLTSGNTQQRVKGKHDLNLVYTRNEDKGMAAPLFHVFNIGDDNGFVIASADDVAVPVLGYCDKGVFDPDSIPVNMQAWLDGYSEEISKARENGVVLPKGDAPAYASRKKINPMIKSTWDQKDPYNDMCVFDGIRCVTGCLATAMAQIMYYWATTGINGKKFRCGSTAIPGYTSIDLEIGALDALESFDWDSMTDGKPTTTKSKAAVAQLMRYCGQSAHTGYSIEKFGSGAFLSDAADAFQDCFDYNYNIQFVKSTGRTEQEWQELVYTELVEGKPFLMAGGGHAFICDGYDPSSNQFHINWGWGGYLDGWFAMTSLTPETGYDFSSMKEGIRGIQPFGNSSYAILSSDGKTLSFYCDTKRKQRTGTIYRMNGFGFNSPGWANDADVEHVVFDSSFSETRPISTYGWFEGKDKLKDITGLSYLNTSDVTDMISMFEGCKSLESIDVSHFNTSRVEHMTSMFRDCNNVKTLDVSHFDTSRATSMFCMFSGCNSLESLDVSHFNTSKVESMVAMFMDCSKLKTLDVSHFDTSKVQSMAIMFRGCSSVKSLDVSHFDTSNVTSMDNMFYLCSNLKSLDVSHFNTSKVTDMGGMFTYCSGLESLDIRNFDMRNVSDVHMLFADCNNLSELYIPTTLPELDDWGCLRVGTSSSPCRLHAPAGFDFGFTPPTNEAFQWKRGWFVLVEDVFAMGDVNHDGQVNITDISLMVDHVLGSQPKVFHKENADMNHDGQVNVTDISLAVDATLGL